jgi:hypothetical protein
MMPVHVRETGVWAGIGSRSVPEIGERFADRRAEGGGDKAVKENGIREL